MALRRNQATKKPRNQSTHHYEDNEQSRLSIQFMVVELEGSRVVD